MNPFDAAVYLILIVAIIMGFKAGLLRSLAAIFGYLAAMPIAVTAAPSLAPLLAGPFKTPQMQTSVALIGVLLAAGILLSAVLRMALNEVVGPRVSVPDRVAGAMLGAVRIVLLAVVMVLIFDRLIPANRQPPFLAGSQLRPLLLVAGQQGLRSLPPDITDYVDRLKRERGI
jgi:membrane protein required for colicin V production